MVCIHETPHISQPQPQAGSQTRSTGIPASPSGVQMCQHGPGRARRGLRKVCATCSLAGTAGLRPEGRGQDRRPEREKWPPPLDRLRGVRSELGQKDISPSIPAPDITHIPSQLFASH